MNPNNPNADIEMSAAKTAAVSLGKELLILHASSEGEIETAFGTMTQQRRDALLVASDTFFISRRDQITSLAARHRMPAIYYLREFAEAGGLITYGATAFTARAALGSPANTTSGTSAMSSRASGRRRSVSPSV
jgi:putative ABC transport system substrate-binding protein